jgi:hypothetical protein
MSGNAFKWRGTPSVFASDKDFARKLPATAEGVLRENKNSNIAYSTKTDRDKTLKIIGRRNEARSQ